MLEGLEHLFVSLCVQLRLHLLASDCILGPIPNRVQLLVLL